MKKSVWYYPCIFLLTHNWMIKSTNLSLLKELSWYINLAIALTE